MRIRCSYQRVSCSSRTGVLEDPAACRKLITHRAEHVERYHEWMSDDNLREQTASEVLSLEEEADMQRSWHLDEDSEFCFPNTRTCY